MLVGKYTRLEDAYASVIKALQHASLAVNHRLDLKVNFGKSEQASNEQISEELLETQGKVSMSNELLETHGILA